jgi:hypothetical protein
MSDEYQPTTEACLRCVVMERELAEAREQRDGWAATAGANMVERDDMRRQRDQWKEFAYKHPEITPPVVTQEIAALRQRHAALREWLLADGELATITVAAVVAHIEAWARREP